MISRFLVPLVLVPAGTLSIWAASQVEVTGLQSLGIFGLVVGGAGFFLPSISIFLRIICCVFAVEAAFACAALSLMPIFGISSGMAFLGPLNVLPLLVFVPLAFLLDRVPVFRRIFELGDFFLESKERIELKVYGRLRLRLKQQTFAASCVTISIVAAQAEIINALQLAAVSSLFTTAINERNADRFWEAVLFMLPLLLVASLAYNFLGKIVTIVLDARWRRAVTDRMITGWLESDQHYAMSLMGNVIDNPDQRIQEDVGQLINTSVPVTAYGFILYYAIQIQQLIAVSVALWQVSAKLENVPSLTVVPGFLLWMAIAWSAGPSFIMYLLSRPVVRLVARQQAAEASFRFGLSRVREYGAQIALMGGGKKEAGLSRQRMDTAINATFVQNAYGMFVNQIMMLFIFVSMLSHYLVIGPFYIAGAISFGVFTEVGQYFSRMTTTLDGFSSIYSYIANIRAIEGRVNVMRQAFRAADSVETGSLIRQDRPDLLVENVQLRLPDGQSLSQPLSLAFEPSKHVLIMGPSGIGKSTLMRTVAGIWPFWTGTVVAPEGQTVLALPQMPYLPLAGLATALAYPGEPDRFSPEALRQVLSDVELPQLIDRLETEDQAWMTGLSGGELQRLSLARALLLEPDWLLLDEATSAMDIPLEGRMYAMLREKLPGTTIISIGHRDSLIAYHDRVVTAVPEPDRGFAMVDGTASLQLIAQ